MGHAGKSIGFSACALFLLVAAVVGCSGGPDAAGFGEPHEEESVDTVQEGLTKDGQPCISNSDCKSGKCLTFYRDSDGDGYGIPGTFAKTCTVPPAGYAAKSTDCYDGNANAFPGQTKYFTVQRGDGSWDYSCNGFVERQYTSSFQIPAGCDAPTGVCSQLCASYGITKSLGFTPACGADFGYGAGCACIPSCSLVGVRVTQGCR